MTSSTIEETVEEFLARTTTDDDESAAVIVEHYEQYLAMSEEDRTFAYMTMLDNAATSTACLLGLFEYLVAPELEGTELEVEGIPGLAAEVLKWGLLR